MISLLDPIRTRCLPVVRALWQLPDAGERIVNDGVVAQLRADTAIAGLVQYIQKPLETGARKKSCFHSPLVRSTVIRSIRP